MQLRRFHLKAYRTQIEYLASHDREELAAATSTSVKVTATQHHHEQLPHPSQRSLPPPHQTLALTDAAAGTPVEALQHDNKSRMIELPQPPHHAVRDSSGATHAAANHAPKPSFVRVSKNRRVYVCDASRELSRIVSVVFASRSVSDRCVVGKK